MPNRAGGKRKKRRKIGKIWRETLWDVGEYSEWGGGAAETATLSRAVRGIIQNRKWNHTAVLRSYRLIR